MRSWVNFEGFIVSSKWGRRKSRNGRENERTSAAAGNRLLHILASEFAKLALVYTTGYERCSGPEHLSYPVVLMRMN